MSPLVIIFVASSCILLVAVLTFIIVFPSVRFHVNAQTVFVLVNFVAEDFGASLLVNSHSMFAVHTLFEAYVPLDEERRDHHLFLISLRQDIPSKWRFLID